MDTVKKKCWKFTNSNKNQQRITMKEGKDEEKSKQNWAIFTHCGSYIRYHQPTLTYKFQNGMQNRQHNRKYAENKKSKHRLQ
jgi:hypothetical protein